MFACESQDGRDFSIGTQPGFAASGIKPVLTSAGSKAVCFLTCGYLVRPLRGFFYIESKI